MALLLGVVGLYGVIAYSSKPTDEGDRHPDGAWQRRNAGLSTRWFCEKRVGLPLPESAIGAVCSLAAATLLRGGLLFGIHPCRTFQLWGEWPQF